MKRLFFLIFVSLFVLSPLAPSAAGQTASPTPTPTPANLIEKHFVRHILNDQANIWTAPFRPHNYDAKWAVPMGLGFAALLASDRTTTGWVQRHGGLPVVSHDVSWFGKPYTTLGVAGAFYAAGRFTHNAKARETGVLAAEALIDTGCVTEVLKFSTQRPRPNSDHGSGEFWDGGSSFPSGHSSSVWALATVVGYEYAHNPWVKYGAFAAATAVSMSRYSGRNHFLSDIVAGGTIGFLIGRYVFREYHTDTDNAAPVKTTTFLHPRVLPYFDARTRTYGASLTWRL